MINIRKASDNVTTWAELKRALQVGRKPIDVGDEIDIELKDGQAVTLVCELVKNGHALLFSKDLLADAHPMNCNWAAENGESLSDMHDFLNNRLRRLLPDDLQDVICGDIRLLKEHEVFGENIYASEEDCEQLHRYRDEKNRIKRMNGIAYPYWLASPRAGNSANFCFVYSSGTASIHGASYSGGVCFGFEV